MGHEKMKDSEIPSSYYSLYNNNYLANCYKYLVRSKFLHFLAILLETLLNIFQELHIYMKDYEPKKDEYKIFFDFFQITSEKFQNLSSLIKILIILLYIIVFDVIYYFLGKIKCKKDNIYISILFNIIEIFFFRISMLFILNIYFCLSYKYFFILLILIISHLYITFYHFLYNHLFIFVPIFIEYPYDEFSSLFDIFSLVIKILLSIIGNNTNVSVRKCVYIITMIFQIYCCIYFIYQLFYHSYLFMKNLFLNKTKVALFFIQTFVFILAELLGKRGILNISFIIIIICLFFITISSVYLIYDPRIYINFNRETPDDNMYFYLFILSYEHQPCYVIENKINSHYEGCGICNLCIKYHNYLFLTFDYIEAEENEKLTFINKDVYKKEDRLINLFFDILYEGKNKYFSLIKEMILTYKNKAKNILDNSSYFFINLSFLIFSELKNNNYNLVLNIKIIMDFVNNDNKLLDIHEAQIKQITLCNKFLALVRSTLDQISNILKSEENKAIKLINLSELLDKMKKPKYREVIFNHKHDNISNSRNIIILCSLIYEEIFNITLNSNQIPLRESSQILEDNFTNTDKTEKIISLALNLTNCNCKIVRAGKDLYNYKDNNLFDLIPLIFKDHLQNSFISRVLENFNESLHRNPKAKKIDLNYNQNAETNINLNTKLQKNNKIINRITMKKEGVEKTVVKNEFIEFNMIISESISSKMFYKLLILKLTPLFNYDYNSCYILLDGSFRLYKNTVMTLQDAKFNATETPQRIISVSKPELEYPPEIYIMTFQKYIIALEKRNFKLTHILDFILSKKMISIYTIVPKDKEAYKRLQRQSYNPNDTIKMKFHAHKEKLNSQKKIEYVEDTTSVKSQPSSFNNNNFASGLNIKIKKKENIYRNSDLYKIENGVYLMIPIIILFLIIEIIHLLDLKKGDYNNDYSLIGFNEFYKIYFQLFTTVLSVVCIKHESGCVNIMKLNSDTIDGLDEYFNTTLFFYGQSQYLLGKLLEKKLNLIDIHKNIGRKKYQEMFEQEVNYTRISKVFGKENIELSLMNIKMVFSEAILISINSFQILTNNTINEPIYLLHKKENPFLYFDSYGIKAKNITDYQKELYEMIINYKIYWQQYRYVYYKLLAALKKQTKDIKFYIFFYFNISHAILIIIMIMLYIYMYKFEQLIVKILNYMNKVINTKDESLDFNFYKDFSQKIENLNIILKLFSQNPINAVSNLSKGYSKYDKYITNKKKNIHTEYNKKNNKKINIIQKEDDDIFAEVPKHLQILKHSNFNKLYIMFYFYLLSFIIIFFLILSYTSLYIMWDKYYIIKDNLYSLLKKDTELEISFFKSLSMYNLMIFSNSTLDDLAKDIFNEQDIIIGNKVNIGAQLLDSFYEDLYLAFNYEIEINILINTFSGFPFFNFTCKNLYDEQSDNIEKLELIPEIQKIGNTADKMLHVCESSHIDYYNDLTYVYETIYQTVRHAVISINDFSYEGLINHLKKGFLGKIYMNFNLVLMYITDIINVKLHKVEYDNLLGFLNNNLIITLALELLLYIALMSIVIFVYISRLKRFCDQIITLKQVFKICEVHEQ